MSSASQIRQVLRTLALVGLAGAGLALAGEGPGLAQASMVFEQTAVSPPGAADSPGGGGYRGLVRHGEVRLPLVVVGGTPYQMGWHLGRLMREEILAFVPVAMEGLIAESGVSTDTLTATWAATAAYTDDRVEQELLGLADGSGLSVILLQQLHCLPLLMPYSCSSLAAWGAATRDGHLYQTRNLDWNLKLGAHNVPVIVLYLPAAGTAHVVPGFAGFVGAHCGMNAAGIVLAEMGDSPRREMPYAVRAPHFTTWFRTLLYDAGSLTAALALFKELPMTKRYHFVFGDGQTDRRAVKIRAHSPETPAERIRIWNDNDPADELAPSVLPQLVYQDEGRGAFPALKAGHGSLDAEAMIAVCNHIPIKGHNVVNAVFDATALRLWVSYAHGDQEAYRSPYVLVELSGLDGDGDSIPDLREGAADRNADGMPDFLNR
jgi:hypothetical protein